MLYLTSGDVSPHFYPLCSRTLTDCWQSVCFPAAAAPGTSGLCIGPCLFGAAGATTVGVCRARRRDVGSLRVMIFRDLTQFSWHIIGVDDVRQCVESAALVVPQLAYPGLLGLATQALGCATHAE